ncbi:AMP-binding protein [soil metagenome]
MVVPRILFPATPPSPPRSLGSLLSDRAQAAPDRPSLTFEGRTWTRSELDSRANRRARAFAALGVGQDDLVMMVLSNGPEFHETVFAIWKLGATPVPVSYRLADGELFAIAATAQPKLIVGDDRELTPGALHLPAGYEPDPALSDAPLPERTASCWKISTSGGSTGRPKLIVDHAPGTVDPDTPSIGLELDDVVLMPAPLYHNGPFTQSNWALAWGAHVVEMARFDALGWLKLVEQHGVRWAYLVPTMMHRIINLPEDVRAKYDVSSIEIAVHMAAPCPAWLKQRWIDWLGPDRIWEVYGGTEAVGGTANNGRDWLQYPGTVGQALGGGEIRILGESGETLPPGEIGQVFFVPPPGREAAGYHYLGVEPAPPGTQESHGESYGDMGHVNEEGFLFLADRRTDLILSGGVNIYPAEVEAAIELFPTVASSVVIGLPNVDMGQRTHAIIEVAPGHPEPEPGELETFLAKHLARYKLPYSCEFVSEPLRDDAGKVRRGVIRDERIARAEAGERFARLRG